MKALIKQFMKFGIVGVTNVAVYTFLYWILIYFHVNYLLSTTIAYLVSSVGGYILNHIWVFKSDKAIQESVLKYYVVYGSSYLLNILCMYIWVDMLELSISIAPILTLCVTTPYNFLFSKIWVFKTHNKND